MILVTGGSGLLGAHLLVKLSEHESEIFALKTKHTNLVSVKKQILQK
jgi:nucleoside-diphosphate-sugar epimerase